MELKNSQKPKFDLEERTAKFDENIIGFAKTISKNSITVSIISQLVRSATSVGSNYCEADCAESRKDFIHKIGICKKEAKETRHWLRMIIVAVPEVAENARMLWQKAHELQLIFISIVSKTRANDLV